MKITLTLDESKFNNLIDNKKIQVGFLEPDIATIAYKNEFGGVYPVSNEYKQEAKAKGYDLPDELAIPPRPFMRFTFDSKNKSWLELLAKLAQKQPEFNLIILLMQLGQIMVGDIQDTIENADKIPNSVPNSSKGPYFTTQIKGFNHPLIKTGNMKSSVRSELVE